MTKEFNKLQLEKTIKNRKDVLVDPERFGISKDRDNSDLKENMEYFEKILKEKY